MAKTDVITILDVVAQTFNRLGGENLPEVVGVIVGVSRNLLPLRGDTSIIVAKRVFVHMRVQVNLGFLVPHGNVVEIVDPHRVLRHDVVGESLLESRSHEIITRSGAGENGKVDLEPEEIHQEGDHDQPSHTSGEVVEELPQAECSTLAVDIHQFPQIDQNRDSHGEEGKSSHIFRANDTAHADSRQEQPLPPLSSKRRMAELVESDVAEDTQRHEEDQSCIEEDQTGLANMSIVEEDQRSSDESGRQTVSRLPHDQVSDGDGQSTHQSGHGSIGDVGDMVVNVRIPNILKQKAPIITHQPTRKREQQFSKRRMHIEEIGPLEVVGSEFAKVNLIEDDLVRVADSPESSQEREEGDDGEADLVVPVTTRLFLDNVQCLFHLFAGQCRRVVVVVAGCHRPLLFRSAALADALRRGHGWLIVGLTEPLDVGLKRVLVEEGREESVRRKKERACGW